MASIRLHCSKNARYHVSTKTDNSRVTKFSTHDIFNIGVHVGWLKATGPRLLFSECQIRLIHSLTDSHFNVDKPKLD